MKNIIINKKEYIVTTTGDYKYSANEMIKFENGATGIVIKATTAGAEIALLKDENKNPVVVGQEVYPSGKPFSFKPSKEMLGSIVDVNGEVIYRVSKTKKKKNGKKDEKTPDTLAKESYIFRMARPIYTRDFVNRPLYSGTTIIDWAIAIGKGQRELILGDRKTGKTTIALNMILAQKDSDTKCVYVCIGQKKSTLDAVVSRIRKAKMEDRVVIVWARANDVATSKYLSPYIGMTFAEHLQENYGDDVLVVFDDLTQHANAYREISLLFDNAPTREAYPGDIFYLHSSLLERAGAYDKEYGGGSITAIPIVQTENEEISSFIPTNVISITDGQIFTSKELFNSGQKPAINVPYSVSRTGSVVQSYTLKKLAGDIKLLVSRYSEAEKMRRLSNSVSKENAIILKNGQALYRIIRQNNLEVNSYPFSALMLILFKGGYIEFLKDEANLLRFRDEVNTYLTETSSGQKLSKILNSQKETEPKIIEIFVQLEILPMLKQFILDENPKMEFNKSFKVKFDDVKIYFKRQIAIQDESVITAKSDFCCNARYYSRTINC